MIISMPLQAWRRRKNYDPMAAAGKKKEVMIDSLNGKTMMMMMTQRCLESSRAAACAAPEGKVQERPRLAEGKMISFSNVIIVLFEIILILTRLTPGRKAPGSAPSSAVSRWETSNSLDWTKSYQNGSITIIFTVIFYHNNPSFQVVGLFWLSESRGRAGKQGGQCWTHTVKVSLNIISIGIFNVNQITSA